MTDVSRWIHLQLVQRVQTTCRTSTGWLPCASSAGPVLLINQSALLHTVNFWLRKKLQSFLTSTHVVLHQLRVRRIMWNYNWSRSMTPENQWLACKIFSKGQQMFGRLLPYDPWWASDSCAAQTGLARRPSMSHVQLVQHLAAAAGGCL